MFIKTILSFFIVFLSFANFAQNFEITHYTTKQKLASNIVHYISQDSIGRLWISTENGLSVFDGSFFKTFNTTNGLIENSILASVSVPNNNLVFSSNTKGLVYKKGDSFSEIKNELGAFFDKLAVRKNKLFASSKNIPGYLYVFNITNTSLSLQQSIYTKEKEYLKGFSIIDDTSIVISGEETIYRYKIENNKYVLKQKVASELIENSFVDDHTLFVFLKNEIVECNLNTLSVVNRITFPKEMGVVKTAIKFQNEFWFSTLNPNCIFVYDLLTQKFRNISSKIRIGNTHVNCFFIDKHSNLWIGTHGKGIFKISAINHQLFSNTNTDFNSYVTSLHTTNTNKLLLGSYSHFFEVQQDSIFIPQYRDQTNQNFYHYGFAEQKNTIISLVNKATSFKPIDFYSQSIEYMCARTCSFINDSIAVSGTWNMKLYFHNINKSVLPIDSIILFDKANRINSIKKWHNDIVLVGSDIGLYNVNVVTKKFNLVDSSFKNLKINDLCVVRNNYFVATDKALFFGTDGKIERISKIGNQPLGIINALFFNSKLNHLYIGSNLGLFIITSNRIYFLNENSGLSFSEINAISYKDDHIIIGGNDGYEKFNIKNYLSNYKIPKTYISSLATNDTLISDIYQNINLDVSNNAKNVNVLFSGTQFQSPNLFYQIKVNNSSPSYTDKGELILPYINYGKTEIVLQTSLDKINWSIPVTLTIFKSQPAYKQTWFLIVIFAIILVLLSLAFSWQIKRIKEKNKKRVELMSELNSIKLRLVNSSTNVHFLSNVLVGIQQYVLKGDVTLASDYLSLFSRHMRNVLVSFQKEKHSLKDELKLLQEFTRLEKLRYQTDIDYELTNTLNEAQQEVLIPPLLLQPLIENSFEHAFNNLKVKQENKITVQLFENADHHIEILIEDNGVGFDDNTQSSETSFGLKVTKDRAKLQDNIFVKFVNLNNVDANSSGTRVQIIIKL